MENKIDVLEDLRDLITNELNISRDNVPSIGKEMSLDASILFLFLTPEKSDPETKGIISLRNDSFACKSLREQMSRVSIPEKDVLVWNYILCHVLFQSNSLLQVLGRRSSLFQPILHVKVVVV